MNRRLVVSILAMLLVLTMILSLVLTVIPVRADGVEQTPSNEASETVQQCIAENNIWASIQTYCLADEGSELRSAVKKGEIEWKNDHAPVSAENLSSSIL